MSAEIAADIGPKWRENEPVLAISPGLHLPFNSRFSQGRRPSTNAAVFLDRDGVIVRDVHYMTTSSQIDLLTDVTALRALQNSFYLIVVTNQSGVARGFLTEADLLAIHKELVLQLAAEGLIIDAFYYCPHLATATVEGYRILCDCRKPGSGMLLRAKADWEIDLGRSYLIGDTPRDIQAGVTAGLAKNILIGGDGSNLSQAVRDILNLNIPASEAKQRS